MELTRIDTFVGLGDLRFGMTRADNRAKLAAAHPSFANPTVLDDGNRDAYGGLGLHLHYDESDQLEFIEAVLPCAPRYHGLSLLGQNAQTVVAGLRSLGCQVVRDDVGYEIPDCGFGLWVPEYTIDAVSMWRKGYYDD